VAGFAATITDASIFKRTNTDSGINPASSSIDIGGSLSGRKEDGREDNQLTITNREG
jgi:hypothetical protein